MISEPEPPAPTPPDGHYWHAFHPRPDSGEGVRRLHPRTARYAVILSAAAVLLLVLVAVPATRAVVQYVDDRVLSFMTEVRSTPVTWVGLAFNIIGGVWVTLPLRIAISVYLAIRRRWWFLATFLLAAASSEVFSTLIKHIYDRPRPPGSLVHTSGASFPSGHAVAASVTALTLIIVLVEPGRARRVWWTWSIVFMLLMAASRAYLRAHWLSDGVEGVLLGSACAVNAALLMQALRNARMRRRGVPHPEERAEKPGPLQADAVEDDPTRRTPTSRAD